MSSIVSPEAPASSSSILRLMPNIVIKGEKKCSRLKEFPRPKKGKKRNYFPSMGLYPPSTLFSVEYFLSVVFLPYSLIREEHGARIQWEGGRDRSGVRIRDWRGRESLLLLHRVTMIPLFVFSVWIWVFVFPVWIWDSPATPQRCPCSRFVKAFLLF